MKDSERRRVRYAHAHLVSAVAKARTELKGQEIGSGRGPQGLRSLEWELRNHVQLAHEALGLASREEADPEVRAALVARGRRYDDREPEDILDEGTRRWRAQDLEVCMMGLLPEDFDLDDDAAEDEEGGGRDD